MTTKTTEPHQQRPTSVVTETIIEPVSEDIPDEVPVTEAPKKKSWFERFFGKSEIMEKCDSVLFWKCYQRR